MEKSIPNENTFNREKGRKSSGRTEEGLLFQSGHTSKCVDILCIEKNDILK